VLECRRLSLSSGDFVLSFTVTVLDEFSVGRTTVSRCVSDLSTAGICEIPVVKGTCDDVLREVLSDSLCLADILLC